MTLSVERMKSPDGGRELLDICQRLIEQAKAQGATDAEAFAEYVKGSNVSLEQNDIKGAEIGEHQAMGIRVFINDQMGFSYVNRFDPDALSEALSDAITIAKTSPGDPANGLVSPQPVDQFTICSAHLSRAETSCRKRILSDSGIEAHGVVAGDTYSPLSAA